MNDRHKKDIFISHEYMDGRIARVLISLLEEHGWSVWNEVNELPTPAGNTSFEIEEALSNAKCIIVLWSNNSAQSVFIREEADEGAKRGNLILVLLEPVRSPSHYKRIKPIELINWRGSPDDPAHHEELNRLIKTVKVLLDEKKPDTAKLDLSEPRKKLLRPLRVFLCHSSADKQSVRDLYHRLRKDGISPWLDEEDLLAGQRWEEEIPKAVRASDVVIVCLSRGSVNKAGYIQKEIKFALDVADLQPEDTIFLIPLKLEECEAPSRLRQWHWVNLFEENGYDRLMRALRVRAESFEQP